MDALVLRVATRHGRGAEFHKFSADAVSVGRGLHNDVIVADPWYGAAQFRLRRAEGRILLDVLDATNPALLNGRRCSGTGIALEPGAVLTLGQTVVKVMLESTPVPPARTDSWAWWAPLGRGRPVLAVLLVALTAAAALYFDYLDTFEVPDWGELLSGVLFLVLVITGWAGLWAVAGRVLRNQPQFSSQLFVSALVTLLTMVLTLGAGYVAYAIGFDAAVHALDWLLGAMLSFTLVYANLRLATNLRRPATAAALLVGLLVFLAYGFEWLEEEEFSPHPVTETLLRAPFAKLRSGLPPDAYAERLDELFAAARDG